MIRPTLRSIRVAVIAATLLTISLTGCDDRTTFDKVTLVASEGFDDDHVRVWIDDEEKLEMVGATTDPVAKIAVSVSFVLSSDSHRIKAQVNDGEIYEEKFSGKDLTLIGVEQISSSGAIEYSFTKNKLKTRAN